MLRKILTTTLVCLISAGVAFAQTGSLSGTVTDGESGEILVGANVYIPDLQKGSPTDANGQYEISDIPVGTYEVRISYIGYTEQTQTVDISDGVNELNVSMQSGMALNEMVVTAMGMSREERSISYSVQEVSGEDLTMASEDNVIGSLAGKVSGVQVVGSPGAALGGTQKIRIRGQSGLSESNPLFVVDGTPISNQSFNISDRDYGNLASDLNLDDIESISVLKGASASALYGNRASDGVIVIETKSGQAGEVQVDLSNTTTFDEVYRLPDYQNEYAGGYSGELVSYTDPETGEQVPGLEYAADESWGPRMEGQEYRPWWSWYHGDFDGDGQDDYGETTTLDPQPDNVRNFYDTGVSISNSLAISGGSENSTYRVSIEDMNRQGVMPNSQLDKTYLNFKGSLSHSDKFTSRVSFNYVNTQGKGRPSQTYSPIQGNPTQMFNQWFQRQLSMDELQNYRLQDGTIATWNIIDPTAENPRPQYWDSPYFSTNENVPKDERDRVYGNYTLSYNISDNLSATGRVHTDFYDFSQNDRIASGGLNQDWFSVQQRSRREMNYEANLQYTRDFESFSLDGLVGGNLRQERTKVITEQTQGGLTVPNLYNIEASADRPDVTNYQSERDVRSIYGTLNVGWNDMVYVDASLRNDWSSALPSDNNSYLYYGLSGSFVFTEMAAFDNAEWLTFGKLRASIAQVGSDLSPYQVTQNFNIQSPRGSYPAMQVPDTRYNPDLRAAISTDYEFGADLRFLDGRLRLDGTYYHSLSEDEILNLQVSSTSGYDQMLVNAGEFEKSGLEFQLEGTPIEGENFAVDVALNYGKMLKNRVNELAEGINSRLLDQASFYSALYAREGEEWGKIISSGYLRHEETGEPIFNPATGGYFRDTNVDHGSILPDWNGGFRLDVQYKNWALGGFVEFQKGGKFYSISKAFNNYAGLGAATTGTNQFGNPYRDPVYNQAGEEVTSVPVDQAAENSGGKLVEGVDEDGNPVQYISNVSSFYYTEFLNQEAYIYDASYVKLKSLRLRYNVSGDLIDSLPIRNASISLHAQNPLIIYSSVSDMDPSIIQEAGTDFGGWWEGGSVPGTRSVGFTVNVGL